MSIANYSDLNTAVANWMKRSDLTSRIPEGIVLAEAKMNRFFRTLNMETKNASFSITGEYVALPTDFGGVKTFYLNTSPKTDLLQMPSGLQTEWYGTTATKPKFYEIVGGNFRFAPVPDTTYSATLIYALKVPALTGSATTNWVITSHPDAYLYGVNAEMCGLLSDSENEAKWNAKFYQVMDEIESDARRIRWSGPMAVRPG